jgi:hypothetical protein
MHVPLDAVLGIASLNDAVKDNLESLLKQHGIELAVRSKPTWYF